MHIYIDESGSFAIPKKPGPSLDCAGALIIPDSSRDHLFREFENLSKQWPKDRGEIKGRLLGEQEIDQTISLCRDAGCLFDCVAIDVGLHRAIEVLVHKERNARNVIKHVTPQHQTSLIRELKQLQSNLRALSIPEYLYMVVMTQLVEALLTSKILYLSQTAPHELGSFRWTLDAKDRTPTRVEKLWDKFVLPWLESSSLRRPHIHLAEGDYTAFSRFMIEADAPPEHLRGFATTWNPEERFLAPDTHLILTEHRRSANSAGEIGLQIADVITNGTRRALIGNLAASGWRYLGEIMTQPIPDRGGEVIHLIQLVEKPRYWRKPSQYHATLASLRRTSRSLLVR